MHGTFRSHAAMARIATLTALVSLVRHGESGSPERRSSIVKNWLFAAVLAGALTLITLPAPGVASEEWPEGLQAVEPLKLWVGLRNSDHVGTRFDVLVGFFLCRAEVGPEERVFDGTLCEPVARGLLEAIRPGGGGGFKSAKLMDVPMEMLVEPGMPQEDRLFVLAAWTRISCAMPGHKSGTLRVWFDGVHNDIGRDRGAGSRLEYVYADYIVTGYLRASNWIDSYPGTKNEYRDTFVTRGGCDVASEWEFVDLWIQYPGY